MKRLSPNILLPLRTYERSLRWALTPCTEKSSTIGSITLKSLSRSIPGLRLSQMNISSRSSASTIQANILNCSSYSV